MGGAGRAGRHRRALRRGRQRILWNPTGEVAAVFGSAHMASPDRHLLDCDFMAGNGTLHRPRSEQPGAEGAEAGSECPVRCADSGCRRIAGGRVAGHSAEAREPVVLVRLTGLRIRGPGALLADPAIWGTGVLAVADVARAASGVGEARREPAIAGAVPHFGDCDPAVLCGWLDVWAAQSADYGGVLALVGSPSVGRWIRKNIIYGSFFNYFAILHDRHLVTNFFDNIHFMRDQDNRNV